MEKVMETITFAVKDLSNMCSILAKGSTCRNIPKP